MRRALNADKDSFAYKASHNIKDDYAQYKEWTDIVGQENMPKSLAEFQELKYNDNDKFTLMEWLVLIAPTSGYAIYCYEDTLQYTMTSQSKGCFWTLIAAAVLAAVIFQIFRKKYDRFVQGYIQQKTDLETNPDNKLLIKAVARKAELVDNLDYVVILIPILLLCTVLYAFQTAVEQLITLLTVVSGSVIAKIGLHAIRLNVQRRDMLRRIDK